MNVLTKAWILYRIAKYLATRYRYDTHYEYLVPGNPKFMGARDAVRLIRDEDVVATSGLGANQWAIIMYWAMRELFQETGHPRDLTVISIGGQGARGRAPGSLEELGHEGLCTRFFTGHVETFKSILRLADAGKCDLQCIPQGVMAYLIEGQGRGEESLLTSTGVGTFVDPRVGTGTPVCNPHGKQWVAVEGDKLRYSLPKINVAVFNVPAADREGNLYIKNAALIGESYEIAKAARKNNGIVIANVGLVVDKGYDSVFLPADAVDAVVVYRQTPQAGSIHHYEYWPAFTTNGTASIHESVARLKFMNHILGFTPRRSAVDNALARLAASTFAEHVRKGSLVNIGVGLPEEVCRLLYDGGLFEDVTFFSESGVLGGLPAPGVFFGTAVCPTKIMTSAQIFHLCYDKLDVSILGMLQADSEGNVNVSKRGEGAINYVGPGGFVDFSAAARTIIFVSSWMVRPQIRIDDDRIRIVRPGPCKFTDKVDEITFSGKQALATGKRVFYATNVGVFQLTPRGMELMRVAPGIDIQSDILNATRMKVVLPESGEVPLVDASIITGKGFKLHLRA